MNIPLVSVICTCYNHREYIQEALDSVVRQDYPSVELVIIDNGSWDDSARHIESWAERSAGRIAVTTIIRASPINYCRSFNQALALISGKYVIDLSGDDALLSSHIRSAVEKLEANPSHLYFSNAFLETAGKRRATFYRVNSHGQASVGVDSGYIYQQVVARTPICAPTLVFPTAILRAEGGYDEDLAYEDFDIIVRLARKYPFLYNDQIGVKKRVLSSSFSAQQYRVRNSKMLPSTLKVCHKIRHMNYTEQENQALMERIMYETKHALASANFDVALGFLDLATEIDVHTWHINLYRWWAKAKLDLSALYILYQKIK